MSQYQESTKGARTAGPWDFLEGGEQESKAKGSATQPPSAQPLPAPRHDQGASKSGGDSAKAAEVFSHYGTDARSTPGDSDTKQDGQQTRDGGSQGKRSDAEPARTTSHPELYTSGRLIEAHNRIIDEIAEEGSSPARLAEKELIEKELGERTIKIILSVVQKDSYMVQDDIFCRVNSDAKSARTDTKSAWTGGKPSFDLPLLAVIPSHGLRGSLWLEFHNQRPFGETYVTGSFWQPPFTKLKHKGGGEGRGTYAVEVFIAPK